MGQPNVSLVNQWGERVTFFVQPHEKDTMMPRIRAELAEYQREEPGSGWKLQTRGEVAQWHDWQD